MWNCWDLFKNKKIYEKIRMLKKLKIENLKISSPFKSRNIKAIIMKTITQKSEIDIDK